MAKLTARFDMQDRMSKKLKKMHGNLEALEKSRDKINKPMMLEVRDNATRQMKRVNKVAEKATQSRTITMSVVDNISKPTEKISRYIKRKFPKTQSLMISVKDKATGQLNSINNFIKRRMPRTHEIIMRARDRSRTVLEGINRYLGKKLLGLHVFEVMARDRAMPTMHKIANYGKRALAKGYTFSVRAIDIATKTVSRIASFAGTALPKYRDFTIRAIDKTARVIGGVKRALFFIPSMITVTLAVVGMGRLGQSTIGAAMDFEGYEIATKHWLDGNEKRANELVEWMRNYTNKTPFDSPDLFPALARGIGVADGNVKEAKELLKISTDMAALTPNRTVEDAMEALADASMGEFQTLKSFNVKMTQEDFAAGGGWEGFLSEMVDTFEGGAEEFSSSARGLTNKLTGYITASFREAGDGILEAMKPRLESMSTWIDNNQDKWMEWRDTVQQAGEQAGDWVFTKLEGAFSYLRDNYLENDEFKNLD